MDANARHPPLCRATQDNLFSRNNIVSQVYHRSMLEFSQHIVGRYTGALQYSWNLNTT